MNENREEEVRGRAYALWEQSGRPHGEHESHWRQALMELGLISPAGEGASRQDQPVAQEARPKPARRKSGAQPAVRDQPEP